jgi:hypothetical protein
VTSAPPTVHPEPRAHHFAPQSWLAGFTDSGEKEGRLWVTDLKRRKQWISNPPNAVIGATSIEFPILPSRTLSRLSARSAQLHDDA